MKVGDRLGRFELTRELGRGSHGVVFEATDVLLGERVAIKALQPWLAGDVTLRERFKRELVLTRRVSHPGVARLHDLHEENGILFISMQYVEGKSLSQILRVGLPPEEKVIHILRGVCGALSVAHAEGVIHRDLKPANIMLTDTDKVIVLDFGIATATGGAGQQLTRPGEAMGSVPYVAPEIWEGGAATALGDQYALAVTGFVCLTRELPYNGKSPLEVLDAIRSTQATVRSRVPTVDPELEAVVLKAMAKKPEDRYPTVADFDEALRQVAERRGHATKPPTGAASVPSGPVPVPVAVAVPSIAPTDATIPQLQAPVLEPMPINSHDAAREAVVAALAEDDEQDAGAAAVAAAMDEDAFGAAFDAALPDVSSAPQVGGAASILIGPATTSVDAFTREQTAVDAARQEATAIVPAPREERTAIIPAPDLSVGGAPLTVASGAFVITNDPTATVVEAAPAGDAVASDVDGMNAVADAFEASVAGKPPVERTALVDRKQRLAELAGSDATMVAVMPDEPAPAKKKGPLPLVLGGLAIAVVVLGVMVTRGGDDDVTPPPPPPVTEPPPPPPVAEPPPPPVADPTTDPSTDPTTDPPPPPAPAPDPTTDPPPPPTLTLEDLEGPPDPEPDPEPPPPDPTGTPKPRLSTAALDAAVSLAVKKGIRVGDVPAYDAALGKGRKAAKRGDKAGLEAAAKAAKSAVESTSVDKAFVSDKLARFNKDFDKVGDAALKAKVQPIAREVLKHISKGQWTDANTKLNTSWSMIRKGR